MSFTSTNMDHLQRSQVWSAELKEIFKDDVMARKYVYWLSNFSDTAGTLNIPSIGRAPVKDYVEGTELTFDKLDTGNFEFQVTDYKASTTAITNKAKQDTYYLSQLISAFVPEQAHAINEELETAIYALANQQVASDDNDINGVAHRFVATGGSDGARIMEPSDFALAKLSLSKAHVPMTNLIGIVDPVTAYHLETATNIVNISNNP